jgi:hypothetical protein
MGSTFARAGLIVALGIVGCARETPVAASNSDAAPKPSRAPERSAPMTTTYAALAKAAFAPLAPAIDASRGPPKIFWREALAPVVPSSWPPNGVVVRYVYARAIGGISDGERIAAPFARIVSAPGAAPRVETLATSLIDLGVQGVRPVRASELPARSLDEVEAEVIALTAAAATSPPPSAIKTAYCFWKKFNGVIADPIAARHREFFGWLACQP